MTASPLQSLALTTPDSLSRLSLKDIILVLFCTATIVLMTLAWMRGSFDSLFVRKEKKHPIEVDVVSDLDAMLIKRVGFRWQERVWNIRPLGLQDFFLVAGALSKLDDLKTRKVKSENELEEAYQNLFDLAVEPIHGQRLLAKNMHYTQISAVFNLIIECIMGKAQVDVEKKSLKAMEMKRLADQAAAMAQKK